MYLWGYFMSGLLNFAGKSARTGLSPFSFTVTYCRALDASVAISDRMPAVSYALKVVLAASVATVFLLAACSTGPTVRSQPMVSVPNAPKMTRVLFFYQEATLRSERISGKGEVAAATPDEAGLYQFGEALVTRAGPAFGKQGVVVAHASVVPPGEWRPVATKVFAELGTANVKNATIVTVTPRGGRTRATTAAATVTIAFEVRVVDGASSKVVWDGMVDTSTWQGRDFLTRNVQATRYDSAYADRFLDALIATLRNNGQL